MPEVDEFARLWFRLTGAGARTSMRQGVFALEQVDAPPSVSGSARVATPGDRERLLRWWIAFGEEVLHEGAPGRDRRGRGYATALTAELSQCLLDGRLFEGGRRFCFLYTDLANPTSNAIYERIGYRRVAESAEIWFG